MVNSLLVSLIIIWKGGALDITIVIKYIKEIVKNKNILHPNCGSISYHLLNYFIYFEEFLELFTGSL